MIISRKNFIKTGSLLAGGVIFGSKLSLARIFQEEANFKVIRNNIGIFTEKGGTMGWYASDDAAVVIDSQFPDSAEHFMNGFKEKTKHKIDFLLNTHHHKDHTTGNQYLKEFVNQIAAHENCPKLQIAQSKGTADEKLVVTADTTYSESWSQDFGKEKVTMRYFGPAHTGGDSIVHFEKSNIVHMGDLVFNGVFPYIDQKGGGSIKGWTDVLEKALSNYPKDADYIFGHAADNNKVIGRYQDLDKMKNYLTALLDLVDRQIKDGKSLDEIKSLKEIPGFAGLKERWEGARAANLEAAYNELSGKS